MTFEFLESQFLDDKFHAGFVTILRFPSVSNTLMTASIDGNQFVYRSELT